MFWIGILPALLLLWIRTGVSESPVWLERQKHLTKQQKKDEVSILRILKRDMLPITIHTSLLMGAFIFSYHSTSFWYPTYLREDVVVQPFWYLIALNFGGISGSMLWGRLSESVGRRSAATMGAVMGVVMIPLFLMTTNPVYMILGAFLIGVGGPGMWGVIPSYLTERFPTAARGAGPGFAYHAGAAIGSFTPTLIGRLKDMGMDHNVAMAWFIGASNIAAILFLWTGPETKGREFKAIDEHDQMERVTR